MSTTASVENEVQSFLMLQNKDPRLAFETVQTQKRQRPDPLEHLVKNYVMPLMNEAQRLRPMAVLDVMIAQSVFQPKNLLSKHQSSMVKYLGLSEPWRRVRTGDRACSES